MHPAHAQLRPAGNQVHEISDGSEPTGSFVAKSAGQWSQGCGKSGTGQNKKEKLCVTSQPAQRRAEDEHDKWDHVEHSTPAARSLPHQPCSCCWQVPVPCRFDCNTHSIPSRLLHGILCLPSTGGECRAQSVILAFQAQIGRVFWLI